MDFFSAQDNARRRTRNLVLLFVLSLLSLLVMTNALLYLIFSVSNTHAELSSTIGNPGWAFYVSVSLAVLLVVVISSLFKTISLRQGGDAIARMMNARLLVSAKSVDEQKLLNVVEEMAIASGTAVPPVYIMDENSINAFAAGHSIDDAVIGVTRGAIQKLNREQLQGVIAHEFSHILHGDMRLNLRLIGLLHGIMVLGFMGHYMLRAASMSRRNNNNAAIAIFGIGLLIIGASGTFFGGLIKAAVSRQREFLADASAVQYTRNPAGIAGALKRIGSDTGDPFLDNPAASQISHALFSEGIKHTFNALFATHPPLETRIRALEPDWNGTFNLTPSPRQSDASPLMAAGFAVKRAGSADDSDIKEAREILHSIPAGHLDAIKEPLGATAVICMLMLKQDMEGQQEVDQIVRNRMGTNSPALVAEIIRLCRVETTILPAQRAAMVNLCLGTLRQLSVTQYQQIRAVWGELLANDPQPDLQSWLIFQLTTSHLDRLLGFETNAQLPQETELQHCQGELSIFLSVLTYSGGMNGIEADLAFKAAAGALKQSSPVLIPANQLTLVGFQQAANQLKSLKLGDKKLFIDAMLLCVYHDKSVTVAENELLRTTSEILGCPLPAKF
ncbi:heat-shock protein HtpX [Gammaproteobacteria bacterium LSUCC0112]|nr:heat-shock protein HtpX [Gammaproteobacteria bacterium LSUCC0112]